MLVNLGMTQETAAKATDEIHRDEKRAVNFHLVQELGVDPTEKPSPWVAAGSSFVMFAIGAIVPLIPYLLGFESLWAGLVCGGVGLMIAGGVAARFTSKAPLVGVVAAVAVRRGRDRRDLCGRHARRYCQHVTLKRAAALVACCVLVAGCGPPQTSTAPQAPAPTFDYLGHVSVPHDFLFGETTVGGLSAISYDVGRQVYYVISDDRSARNPARFYTVRIMFPDNKLGSVDWVDTTPLLDKSGSEFPSLAPNATPPVIPPDPEGIAFDERRQQLYWSSEGERIEDRTRPLLLNPWVRVAGLDGDFRGEFTLPAVLDMSADDTGARQNHGVEGLTLAPDGNSLWAAMEAPGYNDGEPPTQGHGALTRITKFDVDTGAPTAQFAYPLDSVSSGMGGDNGLSDLVALDDDNFLVIERGYGTFVVARIYRASTTQADNVLDRPSLTGVPPKVMSKELMADLSKLPELPHLDNVEGITLGPRLSDGRQSVVLVTDDNFNAQQVTQFYAFAIER